MDNSPPGSIAPAKSRFFYGWYIVIASFSMLFIMGGTGAALFFKPMLDEFGWDRATLSFTGSVGLLAFAAAAPFMGQFIDRFGAKTMLYIATATQTLSAAVLGFTSNLAYVYIGRVLGEIRFLHPTSVLVNRWFAKKRGLALGIVSVGFPGGTLVLSPISQLLILSWGWRETLFFWAALTFVLILPLVIFVKNKPEDIGLAQDGELLVEKAVRSTGPKVETGMSLRDAARTRAFWQLLSSQFICGTSCGFMLTHTVIFATDMGYTEMIGATFMSVQGGVCILGVLLTGQLSDKFRRNRVLGMTFVIRSLAFIVLVVAVAGGGGASLWMLYLGMALFGFGFFTTSPLGSGLAADLFGNLRMGTIIGLVGGLHMVGAAIGTYAGGINYQLSGSYFNNFAIQAGLELVAATLAFLIMKPRQVKAAAAASGGCC